MITPYRWRRIIDVALVQARDGHRRAREWLGRVLGAEDADDELEFTPRQDAAVRLGQLCSKWVVEGVGRAAED